MEFRVVWNKRVEKQVQRLPYRIQLLFFTLVNDIMRTGAIQKKWKNFSSLGGNKYHCHLTYDWVACWKWEKGTVTIEVYYAGSRENAPY